MRVLGGRRGFLRPFGPGFPLWVSILISVFFCGGCGKGGPGAPADAAVRPAETNRALDAAYQRELDDQIGLRARRAAARNRALARMREIEERVRGALPEGASGEQVAAACRKEPEWAGLEAECKARDDELAAQAVEVRDLIRRRIGRENQRLRELAGGAPRGPAAGAGKKKDK